MAADLLPTGYVDLLTDLKGRIRAAQVQAALAVNSELVLLYCDIGRAILERQEREGWGAKVIDRLSHDLRREFPAIKGFSPRNLKYMRAFAQAWPDEAFVQEVLAQSMIYSSRLLHQSPGSATASCSTPGCLRSPHRRVTRSRAHQLARRRPRFPRILTGSPGPATPGTPPRPVLWRGNEGWISMGWNS